MSDVVVPRLWRGDLVTTSSDMAAEVPHFGVPCTGPTDISVGIRIFIKVDDRASDDIFKRAVGGYKVDIM